MRCLDCLVMRNMKPKDVNMKICNSLMSYPFNHKRVAQMYQ